MTRATCVKHPNVIAVMTVNTRGVRQPLCGPCVLEALDIQQAAGNIAEVA